MEYKAIRNIKQFLYAVPIALMSFLPGCSCEKENLPPEAFQEVNPISGDAPLSVHVRGYGKDTDGIEDIRKYKLYKDNLVMQTKSTPIDTNLIFVDIGIYKIRTEVIDSKNQSNSTEPVTITTYRGKYIEHSAILVNDVEISYSATLDKVNDAELKINKDGQLFITQQITDNSQTAPDFQKTFTYTSDGTTKGNYEFVLKSGDLEKKVSVNIPDYKHTLNFGGVNTDIVESEEKIFDLSDKKEEKNPEDKPVTIKSVKSLNDKIQVTLNGDDLTVKALGFNTGNYQVEFELQNSQGKLEKAVLSGNIIKAPWTYYVNPFVATNTNGAAYDLLTTKAERDAYIQQKLDEDWTDTIPAITAIWDCTEFAKQVFYNFHGITTPEIFVELPKYFGEDLDSLYFYHGTLKDNGKYGLPVYYVYLKGDGIEHNMNCSLTGEIENGDITKFENWNFIESSNDKTKRKIGEFPFPENFTVEIKAPLRDRQGAYSLVYCPILKFNIENGVQTSYWINESSNLKIFTEREK